MSDLGNRIHPTAIIGSDVVLGERNVIGPYTVIAGPAVIGSDNWIGPSVAIGTPGEIRGAEHRASWDEGSAGMVRIGDRNTIREFVTVQVAAGTETIIGSGCYIMTKAHLAHDVVLSDDVTFSCGVLLAGHVLVGQGANLGLNTTVHQFTAVGAGCMIGMGSVVTKPVLPFSMSYGSPARRRGVNVRGADKLGVTEEDCETLGQLYADQSWVPNSESIPDSARAAFDIWEADQQTLARPRPPA